MLAGDRALVGHDLPAIGDLDQFLYPRVLDDLGTALAGSPCIGMHGAGRVEIALAVGPHGTEDAVRRHDRATLPGLFRRDQLAIVDADRLEDAVGRLQPFPAFGRPGKGQASGHVHADVLSRFLLDL